MKKSLIIVILLVVLLSIFSSCDFSKQYDPDSAVEEYLNTGLKAQKSMDKVKSVQYVTTETQSKMDGAILGECKFEVKIDISDKSNLFLQIDQTYSGNYVENGVVTQKIVFQKQEGKYIRTTTNNALKAPKVEKLEDQFVLDYITSLFYINNEAYDQGGLYYGDFFMLNIYRYPAECFYIEQDTNLCVYNGAMRVDNKEYGEIIIDQICKVNKYGLLVSNEESFESKKENKALKSTLQATYTFFEE